MFFGFDAIIKAKAKGKFAVGSGVTLADLVILDCIEMAKIIASSDEFLKHHEPMKAVHDNIKTQGSLGEYLAERDAPK